MKSTKNFLILAVFVVVAMTSGLIAATNYKGEGEVVTLTWATTSPTKGDAVVKGTSKALGAIVGVALNGAATAAESVQVVTRGVVSVSVTASSTIGNIGIGDYVYGSMAGDKEVSTTILSNNSAGIMFGQALEAVTASTTAGVYSTIKVLMHQPGHL